MRRHPVLGLNCEAEHYGPLLGQTQQSLTSASSAAKSHEGADICARDEAILVAVCYSRAMAERLKCFRREFLVKSRPTRLAAKTSAEDQKLPLSRSRARPLFLEHRTLIWPVRASAGATSRPTRPRRECSFRPDADDRSVRPAPACHDLRVNFGGLAARWSAGGAPSALPWAGWQVRHESTSSSSPSVAGIATKFRRYSSRTQPERQVTIRAIWAWA